MLNDGLPEKPWFCNIYDHQYLENQCNSKKNFTQQQRIKPNIEESESVEIEVSNLSGEIERLYYQIEQIDMNKQDMLRELDLLQHEIVTIKRYSKSKKLSLKESIVRIEGVLYSRQKELSHVNIKLKTASTNLNSIKESTSEIFKKFKDTKEYHFQLINECEELKKRSKEASMDLSRNLSHISDGHKEISELTIQKSKMQSMFNDKQNLVNMKEREFWNILEKISDAQAKLSDIESILNIQSEKSKENLRLISDKEQMLQESRMELNKLKTEISLKQSEYDEIEILRKEKEDILVIETEEIDKLKNLHKKLIQKHKVEKITFANEIKMMKEQLKDSVEKKEIYFDEFKTLKSKRKELEEDIEIKENLLIDHKKELKKRIWQIENNDSIIKMKEKELDKIQIEYDSKFCKYNKLQQDILEQQEKSKEIDIEIKTKTADIERLKCISMTETEHLERMKFDKDNMESSLSNLKNAKAILQNQNRELDDSLSMKRILETNLQNSISNIESRLSDAHGDLGKLLNEKKSELEVQHKVKLQTDNLNKQLHAVKCELQNIRDRVTIFEVKYDEMAIKMPTKRLKYEKLNSDISKLQNQLRLMHLSNGEMNIDEISS